MLDRIQIWIDSEQNTVIEIQNDQGGVYLLEVVPESEWKDKRDKLIQSMPGNVSVWSLVDYLVALMTVLETH